MNENACVDAEMLPDGSLRPRMFSLGDKSWRVMDVGRQWIERQERHVLVMTESRETFELIVEMPQMHWRALQVGHRPSNA